MTLKPVLGGFKPEAAKRPDAGQVPQKQLWTFSMRFWRQAEYFGVGDQQASWFISLCERLAALCSIGLDEFFKDNQARDNFRFHEIDWDAKNVPVRRSDFDWVPPTYLENEDDYPFHQFHVSKALGRVVGFFDEKRVFNVVIFDPHHNIQPSKKTAYQIRPTRIGACEITTIAARAHSFASQCQVPECFVKLGIRDELEQAIATFSGSVFICRVDDGQHQRYIALRERGLASDLTEILEYGLVAYEEQVA